MVIGFDFMLRAPVLTFVTMIMLLLDIGPPRAEPASTPEIHTSDFQFGKGSPFVGATTIGGTSIELVTTNTEPYGRASFRDIPNKKPAKITFCFSAPIKKFRLTFSRLLKGETVRDFSAGRPSRIEGDLIDTGSGAYSVPADVHDNGKGALSWSRLNVRKFTFVIDKPWGALAVDTFSFAPIGTTGKQMEAATMVHVCNPDRGQGGESKQNSDGGRISEPHTPSNGGDGGSLNTEIDGLPQGGSIGREQSGEKNSK